MKVPVRTTTIPCGTASGRRASDQSVERRSSGALSALAGSDFASSFTGSSLALSTAGVATLEETSARASAGRACAACSERGRATERAFQPKRKDWHPSMAATAAGPAVSLSAEARAAWARANGYAVA